MAIVTLTSDLGNKDHYAALLKAGILSAEPSTTIVDISHEIQPHNISQAAYILKSSFAQFPEGTIHIAAVDTGNVSVPSILLQYMNHFFIGPDNGLLSLVLESDAQEMVLLPKPEKHTTFIAKDVFVPACIYLLQGKKITDLGQSLQHIVTKIPVTPPVGDDFIMAGVIHIDRFGNIILNITKSQFNSIVQGRQVSISYSRRDVFTQISNSYDDVPEGERLILFNSAGHLEIAVNKGNAHALLGIQIDARIQIEIK